jgi:hypothetical protein
MTDPIYHEWVGLSYDEQIIMAVDLQRILREKLVKEHDPRVNQLQGPLKAIEAITTIYEILENDTVDYLTNKEHSFIKKIIAGLIRVRKKELELASTNPTVTQHFFDLLNRQIHQSTT